MIDDSLDRKGYCIDLDCMGVAWRTALSFTFRCKGRDLDTGRAS